MGDLLPPVWGTSSLPIGGPPCEHSAWRVPPTLTRRRVAKLGEEVPPQAGEEVPAERVKRGEEVVAKR